MIGRMIKPGFVPGSFTHKLSPRPRKLMVRRKDRLPSITKIAEDVNVAATGFLTERGLGPIHDHWRGPGRPHSPR